MTHEEEHRELSALAKRIERAMGQDAAIQRFNELARAHAERPHCPNSHHPADHRPLSQIARDRFVWHRGEVEWVCQAPEENR
jgi:hypothetical protein